MPKFGYFVSRKINLTINFFYRCMNLFKLFVDRFKASPHHKGEVVEGDIFTVLIHISILPVQTPAGLVLGDAGFEKVLFL